jgi:hypothetical protein
MVEPHLSFTFERNIVLLTGEGYVFDASCDAPNYVFDNNSYLKLDLLPIVFSQKLKSFSEWKELAGKDRGSQVAYYQGAGGNERVFGYNNIPWAEILKASPIVVPVAFDITPRITRQVRDVPDFFDKSNK